MARKGPVEFKGKLTGIYMNLDPNETFEKIMEFLEELLVDKASFYMGSKILGVQGRSLTYKQKAAMETLIFDRFGIEIESLEVPVLDRPKRVIEPPQKAVELPQKEVAIAIDEPTEKENTVNDIIVKKKPVVKEDVAVVKKPDTHFVYGTLRSGKSVQYAGNVVLIGDVNPGAEIIAEGNIIVLGRVLGFIHAGSAGNDDAIVIANILKPTQIRISKAISVPPNDDENHHSGVPEKATISDGLIKIEECH